MKVRYCITTYNRPDYLPKAVEAALASTLVPDQIVVVDNSEDGYAPGLLREYPRTVVIARGWNAGLSASWNLCLDLFDDYVIFGNDDLAVHPEAIERTVASMKEHPEVALFFGATDPYSYFAVHQWAYREVGPFDEEYYPVWWMDVDWSYRAKLLGHQPLTLPDVTFDHIQSGSMKQLIAEKGEAGERLHNATFLRNEARYKRKWGGPVGQERYTVPFNGQER